ncbi:MAG: hypothetical protein ACNA8K_16440 [Cyclonatronaceae bacterium]
METLLALLILIIITGALLGGNSLGETVRKGCGCLIAIVVITIVIAMLILSQTDSETMPENQELISNVD